MTRVDFYLLPLSEPHGRLSFACRLTERAFREGRQVYLHAPDATDAQAMDAILWGFRDSSFVPHSLVSSAGDHGAAPIVIGHGEDPGEHHDVLINLDVRIPSFFGRFDRVAEIVLNDPEQRDASRTRWSYYRDRGYELNHHDLQHLRFADER